MMMEVVCRSERFTAAGTPCQMEHWGREGPKKMRKQTRWKEMQKTLKWQIHSRSHNRTAGNAGRDKIMC
jgi:hypothetical protein